MVQKVYMSKTETKINIPKDNFVMYQPLVTSEAI